MKANIISKCILLSLIAPALLIGCTDSANVSAPPPPRKIFSYDDFKGWGPATNGGHLTSIIAEFGDPDFSRHRGGGTNYLIFHMDRSHEVPFGLVGVCMFEKDGIVFNVQPITGNHPPLFTKQQREAAKNITPRDVSLKVDGSAVTLHPVMAAPSQINENATTNTLMLRAVIDLTDSDEEALRLLTSTNIGKTLRVYLEDNPVSEIRIHEEMKTNTIEFSLQPPGLPLEKLYRLRTEAERTNRTGVPKLRGF